MVANRRALGDRGNRRGKRQGHVGVAKELPFRIPGEGQCVRWNEQPIAQLRDSESVVRERLGVVKERPTGRSDFVVVALRGRVHTELRRAVAKAVAAPVAEPSLDGLEDAAPGRSALRPVISRDGADRGQGLVLVVGVVGHDPAAGETDLEVGQRLVDQRPRRRVETHAHAVGRAVVGLTRAVADVAMQTTTALRQGALLCFLCRGGRHKRQGKNRDHELGHEEARHACIGADSRGRVPRNSTSNLAGPVSNSCLYFDLRAIRVSR